MAPILQKSRHFTARDAQEAVNSNQEGHLVHSSGHVVYGSLLRVEGSNLVTFNELAPFGHLYMAGSSGLPGALEQEYTRHSMVWKYSYIKAHSCAYGARPWMTHTAS